MSFKAGSDKNFDIELSDFITSFKILNNFFSYPEEQTISALLKSETGKSVLGADNMSGLDFDSFVTELETDYTALFITGFPHIKAPPYAAYYLDNEDAVFDYLINTYHNAKATEFMRVNDRPDHLYNELAYIIVSLEKNINLNELFAFVSEHFSSWVVPFAEKIENGAQTQFYINIGHLLIDETKRLLSWLKSVVEIS